LKSGMSEFTSFFIAS